MFPKRNNPATYAEKPSSPPKATATSTSNANSASTSEATATENNEVPTVTKGNNSNETKKSIRYCHYFRNFGTCDHQEKTGYKCRYEHIIYAVLMDVVTFQFQPKKFKY